MIRLFKKNITITAHLDKRYAGLLNNFPISHSAKYLPHGWKDLPIGKFDWNIFDSFPNVKSCMGILNTIKTGFVMPLWSDLALEWNNEGLRYRFADGISECGFHPSEQFPNFYSDYYYLKLVSPWLLHSSENIKILCTNHFYSFNKPEPYITPYAILDTIHNWTSTNLFLFFKKEKETQRLIIEAGTPILHFIPLTDKKIKIENVMISEENQFNLGTPVIAKFVSRGLKTIKLIKSKTVVKS